MEVILDTKASLTAPPNRQPPADGRQALYVRDGDCIEADVILWCTGGHPVGLDIARVSGPALGTEGGLPAEAAPAQQQSSSGGAAAVRLTPAAQALVERQLLGSLPPDGTPATAPPATPNPAQNPSPPAASQPPAQLAAPSAPIPTTPTMLVKGSSRVLSAGDCQSSPEEKTAVNASLAAWVAAKNAESVLPLSPAESHRLQGEFVGRRVGKLLGKLG